MNMNQKEDLEKKYLEIRSHFISTFKIVYGMDKQYKFIDEKDKIAFGKINQQLILMLKDSIQLNLKMVKFAEQLTDLDEIKI